MRVLVVYKKSAWELFSSSGDPNVSAFLAESGRDADTFRASHSIQKDTLRAVAGALAAIDAKVDLAYRGDLAAPRFAGIDLAMSVGGDGTFIETSHWLGDDTPVLGVNSDPSRSVGFFCAADADNVAETLAGLASAPRTRVERAAVRIDGEPAGPPVLNDILFASPNPAATTRYRIGDVRYRNSGLLACTAAGSTAWMFQEGGQPMPIADPRLQVLHRGTRDARPELVEALSLQSLTRRGRVFVDGEHLHLRLGIGQSLELAPGPPLHVVGDLAGRRDTFLARTEPTNPCPPNPAKPSTPAASTP